MILLDFSQVAIGNLHQQIKQTKRREQKELDDMGPEEEVEPNLLRHMILSSIRKNNRQFSKDYGQMVICTDDHDCWRKMYFAQYKGRRKKDRDESGINWPLVYKVLDELRNELREYFPYKVLHVPLAEADDIIGVVAKNFHKEKVLIISGDKDFMQLQAYPNVNQFAPIKDEFLTTYDPAAFLKEHIIRGDARDGVPNFLSPDDVLVTVGARQKSIFQKKVDVWLTQQPEQICETEEQLKNYRRNEKMVDLNQIPVEIQAAILEEFDKPIIGDKSKIYGYFVKFRMSNLLEMIRDF